MVSYPFINQTNIVHQSRFRNESAITVVNESQDPVQVDGKEPNANSTTNVQPNDVRCRVIYVRCRVIWKIV